MKLLRTTALTSFLALVGGCASPTASAGAGLMPRTAESPANGAELRISPEGTEAADKATTLDRTPKPVPPQRPLPKGSIGGPYPSLLRAAASDGSWVALCQAREDSDGNGEVAIHVGQRGELSGDLLRTYLVIGTGLGIEIEQLLAYGPKGRFLVYGSEGRTFLHDLKTQQLTDLSLLGADVLDDRQSFAQHRALSFDRSGKQLAYIRRHGERTWVVVRDLESGTERVVSPGAGRLWRLAFEPDGAFLRLDMVLRDSNGNRRLEWPAPEMRETKPSCVPPVPQFNVWQNARDSATTRLVRLKGLKLLEPRGFVLTVGGGIVSRNEDSELWWRLSDGQRVKVASAQCAARVLHAYAGGSANQQAILFGCATAFGARRKMFIRTRRARTQLRFDLAAFELDGRFYKNARLLSLYPRNSTFLVDLARARGAPMKSETRVLAIHGQSALSARGNALYHATAGTNGRGELTLAERRLKGKRNKFSLVTQSGALVAIDRQLFDLASGRSVGTFQLKPLTLSATGHGLLPTRRAVNGSLQGPFRWVHAQ